MYNIRPSSTEDASPEIRPESGSRYGCDPSPQVVVMEEATHKTPGAQRLLVRRGRSLATDVGYTASDHDSVSVGVSKTGGRLV